MAKSKSIKDRNYRIPIQILIEYEIENRPVTMFCTNLSAGGVFIETDSPAPKGSQLKLKFTLPSEKKTFSIQSKVMWIRGKAEGELASGMGLEFEGVDHATKQLIDKAVAYLKDIIEERH